VNCHACWITHPGVTSSRGAIAEDTWQRSVVGVVTLSNEEQHVEEALQKVLAEADRILGPLVVGHGVEIL
jgi:Protein of unknown function (DUF503)